MEVGSSTQAPASAASQATQTASSAASLNYDSFLRLLIAQMKNQDPTQPMDATQQMSQLATFSQVEQTIQTNKRLEMLLQSSALSEADAVIGRTLTSADGAISGTVTEVRLNSDGITAILDTGKELQVTPGVRVS
jgi:flagellar basal-body rod modification protein FlgD